MSAQERTVVRWALRGAAAGAAGTTALNAATYLDMAVRGRPSSTTPEQTVQRIADALQLRVPGSGAARDHRITGLGALSGLAAGVGTGKALGLARAAGWRPSPVQALVAATVAALLVGNGPMTLLKVTEPRTWGVFGWLSDLLPHVAYGVVTATVLEALAP